jgi:hypothetical protein
MSASEMGHGPRTAVCASPARLPTLHSPPALAYFELKGVTKYLEQLVTRIDTPQLDKIHITTFSNHIDFDCPQLAQFTNWQCTPTLGALLEARVQFDDSTAKHPSPTSIPNISDCQAMANLR